MAPGEGFSVQVIRIRDAGLRCDELLGPGSARRFDHRPDPRQAIHQQGAIETRVIAADRRFGAMQIRHDFSGRTTVNHVAQCQQDPPIARIELAYPLTCVVLCLLGMPIGWRSHAREGDRGMKGCREFLCSGGGERVTVACCAVQMVRSSETSYPPDETNHDPDNRGITDTIAARRGSNQVTEAIKRDSTPSRIAPGRKRQ